MEFIFSEIERIRNERNLISSILSVFDPSVILYEILETVFFEEHFTRLFVLLVKIYDVKFRSVRN